MKVLVGVNHPKHVFFFKNTVDNLIKRGHEVKIVAVEKEITAYLLEHFNLPYTLIGVNQPKLYRKVIALLSLEYRTYRIAKEFKPDIFVGRALPHFAHVSAILNKPFIIFEDTEHATAVQKICLPFTDAVVTPDCYMRDFGERHVRFSGYYELAYLHPNYFKPDPSVLDDLGLSRDDKFIIIRLVSWGASHDIGHSGLTLDTKRNAIKEFEKYGDVLITSESPLPSEFEKYRIRVAPEKIHDLMYYATLLYGESATMAVEAGILGTPAIYVSSLVGTMGNLSELEERYGLVCSFKTTEDALKEALQLLTDKNLKNEWHERRERLLNAKEDTTKFMTEFIENYPESFEDLKSDTIWCK